MNVRKRIKWLCNGEWYGNSQESPFEGSTIWAETWMCGRRQPCQGQVYRNKLPLSLSFQPGPLHSILYMDSGDDLSQNTSKTPQGVTQALPDLSALLIWAPGSSHAWSPSLNFPESKITFYCLNQFESRFCHFQPNINLVLQLASCLSVFPPWDCKLL